MLRVVISVYKDKNVQPLFQIQGDAFEPLSWEAEEERKGLKDDGKIIRHIAYMPHLVDGKVKE